MLLGVILRHSCSLLIDAGTGTLTPLLRSVFYHVFYTCIFIALRCTASSRVLTACKKL